ncbi:MAG: Cytochrome c oxidase polypeptide III [uncultured Frankineae bacterium]|uniref:cytochrome-c oxidase n=1 Tax=uncultured Frankineae bacterium TaxID=437475 RepID=A0A6J4L0P7_9ACTN|nr:MAG: Cytochrome c oxidase polypeptide III [uncultured Frankineae bacterium]
MVEVGGGCHDARVTTAPALQKLPAHGSLTRPNMVSVGTIVWLSSELMFFAALFAMYFTIRSVQGQEVWREANEVLNVPYSLVFTVILVASSLTCQLGVFAAERGDVYGLRKWFVLTLGMGAVFVGGQIYEYISLVTHENTSISSSPYGSVFYLTTGFHGLHVIGGLFAFVIVLMRSTIGRFSPEKATSAIVVSYYWHFVDVVWIGLFAAIYIIR